MDNLARVLAPKPQGFFRQPVASPGVIRFLEVDELGRRGEEGYLADLLRIGAAGMAANAAASVRIIRVGHRALPLLIVDPTRANCDLCSPQAHHVHYARDEIERRVSRWSRWPLRLAYAVFGGLLSVGRLDKVVYIDNWLYSTNPGLQLTVAELRAVRAFVEWHYPGYAQVVRSVQPALFPDQLELFEQGGYKLQKGRDVFLWPRDDASYLERENYRRDSRLLQRSRHRFVEASHMGPLESARLHQLYSELYLEKHNRLNACLTEQFFVSTYRSGALQYRFLMDGETLVGFYCFTLTSEVFVAVALGYDLSAPRRDGLYRQIVMSCIREAKARKLSLSFSAGVDDFKASRGGKPYIEYEAVYDRHLPWRQRCAWWLLGLKCRVSVWLALRSC